MMWAMALCTPFTELFSLRHPIALAPMGGSAGGALAVFGERQVPFVIEQPGFGPGDVCREPFGHGRRERTCPACRA